MKSQLQRMSENATMKCPHCGMIHRKSTFGIQTHKAVCKNKPEDDNTK